LFFDIKFVLELKSLLRSASGVRIKKNITESKMFGIIRLNMKDNLYHSFSIIKEDLNENTPIPERNNEM
tara:strand:+ start:148 stop:354 length:207 start_codon:yes stop_codon:yes gene_type:complete